MIKRIAKRPTERCSCTWIQSLNVLSWGVLKCVVTMAVVVFASGSVLQAASPATEPSARSSPQAPANEPAQLTVAPAGGLVVLSYNGRQIFKAELAIQSAAGDTVVGAADIATRTDPAKAVDEAKAVLVETSHTRGEREQVEQKITFRLRQPKEGMSLRVRAEVFGSAQAFPAESEPSAQKRFAFVRNSVGLSHNLRNNAVYDRQFDWVLAGPADGSTRITPQRQANGAITFVLESRGPEVTLTFRPRFYQKHKGLSYFEPWTYAVWQDSVTGWCSWWAYMGKFGQKDLDETLAVLSEKNLAGFGYRHVQIDDTFQGGSGTPESWLKWNAKFPGGIDYYARSVKAAGFDPGIWISAGFRDEPTVKAHPEWFVRSPEGVPKSGKWIFYGIDTTVDEAAAALVRPTYGGLRQKGFGYVKIDTLRHLFYDNLNQVPTYAASRGTTSDEILRRYVATARQELGRDTFILACWGVLPEVVGVADGCRLGGDGFGPATLQQYNSWNGVVWRNDPDHCDVLPRRKAADAGNVTATTQATAALTESRLRPSLVSLAGAMLMISDKPEVYRDDRNIEGVKRASPVLFTVPGQLYDYDPSKSDNLVKLKRTDTKRGAGPSPIDAVGGHVCPWWLLEVDRPFENWSVLARVNFAEGPDQALPEMQVNFADLGLAPDGEYLVYEFWSKRFLGVCKDSFKAASLGPKDIAVYSIRRKLDHPQILSTSRHISQGGVDLEAVTWDAAKLTLSGNSQVVKADAYDLVVHVPTGFVFDSAEAGALAGTQVGADGRLVVRVSPTKTATVRWALRFRRDR